MQITVHLDPTVATELHHGRTDSHATSELMQTIEKLAIQLTPMHPGSSDSALASVFTVNVEDLEEAKRIIASLSDLDATEAAYVKPPPAMP